MDREECGKIHIFDNREVLVKWTDQATYQRAPAIMLKACTAYTYNWFTFVTSKERAEEEKHLLKKGTNWRTQNYRNLRSKFYM